MKKSLLFKWLVGGLLLILCLPSYPKSIEAPPRPYSKISLPENYFTKINHTFWISYFADESNIRKIGLTIEPPFYWDLISVRKTIRPNLFGEIEIKGNLRYQNQNSIQCNAWINLLTNQDAVLFLRIENRRTLPIPFLYGITYEDEESQKWITKEIYPFRYANMNLDKDFNPMKFEKTDELKTKGEPYLLQTLRYDEIVHQILKGPLFVYQQKNNGLQERMERLSSSELSNSEGKIKIQSQVQLESADILEDWVFFSSNKLLSIHSALTQKIIQNLDFYKVKRFSRDGFYYLSLNDGYVGESENTYYWDYSMYGARSILEYYYQEDQTLLYDIAILCYLSLSRNRNPQGWWSNQTISSWLQTDYGITNQYFDTRFNVDAGIFLLEIYQNFSIPYALTMAQKVAETLRVMMQNGKGYPTDNQGLLLQDYDISYLSPVRTHASLNHVLNEISFLLLMYKTTRHDEYKEDSLSLLRGIEGTVENWKNKKTGDLFYCRFPQGTFGREDYVTLTYHDLIRARRLVKEIQGEEFAPIINLGKFKEGFLIKKGLIQNQKF